MADLALRATAIRRGVRLEGFTIAWMAVEAVLAIGAGVAARSHCGVCEWRPAAETTHESTWWSGEQFGSQLRC